MITLEQFSAMIPRNKEAEEWFDVAVPLFEEYEIDSVERIAGFMAQCAHESADFTRLEENLNYSEKALNSVFGRYFGTGKEDAAEYARNPEKIANYVYMDEFRSKRGALGNTEPGDGWRFRGRGVKQLTGRNNYTQFADDIGISAEEAAEYLETKQGALESACWFWKKANLAPIADKGDIVGLTKKINGGTIGLDDRTRRYKEALQIMGGEYTPPKEEPKAAGGSRTLRRRMQGDDVARMQKAIGISPADGIFGIGTDSAVREWQKANGLVADGIVGPATQAKMFG